jgi:hypothetical protein
VDGHPEREKIVWVMGENPERIAVFSVSISKEEKY